MNTNKKKNQIHYIMKKLLLATLLIISAFGQEIVRSADNPIGHEHLYIQETGSNQPVQLISPQPTQISPDWAFIDEHYFEEQNPQNIEEIAQIDEQEVPQNKPHFNHNAQNKQHKKMKHHKKHFKNSHNVQSEGSDASYQSEKEWSHQDNEWNQQQRSHEMMSNHEKKHWRKFGCIALFTIVGILSLFIIRKCVLKRKHQRRRFYELNLMRNPTLIDEEINKHYSEINRLTNLKNSIRVQQAQSQPIIYANLYPQNGHNIQLTNMSQGRMINENYLPQNSRQQPQFQQIPMGRPMRNQNRPYANNY